MGGFVVDSVDPTSVASESGIHQAKNSVVRVLGIGGGGGNALQHMINQSIGGVEFIAVNTDAQALNASTAPLKVQIGVKLTNGLGSGCDPNKGRKAAEESRDDIKKLLAGSDLIFITAGMGGGTGTGAAPIIAEIARESGALTVAVVTKPFYFEGKRHTVNAEAGITELSKHVDSLIVMDNDKLLSNLGANISIISAFNEANDVLLNAVRGITDIITIKGFINLDFSDVETIMQGRGHAMIGTGAGQGANFCEDAIQRAIHSPLIEEVEIRSATGLLAYARVNPNFPLHKWEQIMKEIQSYADEEADCKLGIVFDDQIQEDQIEITILITGISSAEVSNSERQFNSSGRTSLNRRPPSGNDNGFFRNVQQQNYVPPVRPAAPAAAGTGAAAQNRPAAVAGGEHRIQQVNTVGNGLAPNGFSSIASQEVNFNGNSSSSSSSDEWNESNEIPSIFRKKV